MRKNQKLATKEKIIRSARELLEKTEYEKTTLRQIAHHAEIALGSIFVHFKSKEDLFYSVFYDDLEQLMLEIRKEPPQQSVFESLTRVTHHIFSHFAKHPILYSDLLRLSLFATDDWQHRFRQQTEDFAKDIASIYQWGIQQGELTQKINIQAAVANFIAMYYFCLIVLINQKFTKIDSLEKMLSAMLSQHLVGLTERGIQ